MSDHGQLRFGSQFARTDVTADPVAAAQLRRDFAAWLQHCFVLDATRASDMVLAVNEALANAAEFAYIAADRPGAMHMWADYDTVAATLAVTVTDEGIWRTIGPSAHSLTRGRGIPLMHALADRVTIDPTSAGTRVRLEWKHVASADGVQG